MELDEFDINSFFSELSAGDNVDGILDYTNILMSGKQSGKSSMLEYFSSYIEENASQFDAEMFTPFTYPAEEDILRVESKLNYLLNLVNPDTKEYKFIQLCLTNINSGYALTEKCIAYLNIIYINNKKY